jgi:hypothetical protein
MRVTALTAALVRLFVRCFLRTARQAVVLNTSLAETAYCSACCGIITLHHVVRNKTLQIRYTLCPDPLRAPATAGWQVKQTNN